MKKFIPSASVVSAMICERCMTCFTTLQNRYPFLKCKLLCGKSDFNYLGDRISIRILLLIHPNTKHMYVHRIHMRTRLKDHVAVESFPERSLITESLRCSYRPDKELNEQNEIVMRGGSLIGSHGFKCTESNRILGSASLGREKHVRKSVYSSDLIHIAPIPSIARQRRRLRTTD